MYKVLVFKTSVAEQLEILSLQAVLDRITGYQGQWNFDLEDCDNILRVEAPDPRPELIEAALGDLGYECVELK